MEILSSERKKMVSRSRAYFTWNRYYSKRNHLNIYKNYARSTVEYLYEDVCLIEFELKMCKCDRTAIAHTEGKIAHRSSVFVLIIAKFIV